MDDTSQSQIPAWCDHALLLGCHIKNCLAIHSSKSYDKSVLKSDDNKYKKQLKVTSLKFNGDGSAKKFTNKSLGMMTNEVLPYMFHRSIVTCLKEM